MMRPGERGSVGNLFAAVLILLGALSVGASAFVGRALDYGRRIEAREELRRRLRAAIDETVDLLAADESPESDGPYDRVWSALAGRSDGISLSLSDLSSRPNPNFIAADFLERTDLHSLLAPGLSPADLAAYREEKGLSTELGHYRSFLREDSLESWSCFGWANANLADLRSLRALYRSRTGDDDGADAFSLRVAAARSLGRLATDESLRDLLGSAYPEVFPVICARAPHNANFASVSLLRAILSYPPLGITESSARADAVVAARADHDLSVEELAALIGPASVERSGSDAGNRASACASATQYLGVRTWFWIVGAEAEGRSCRAVVAVWPEDADGADDFRGDGSTSSGAAARAVADEAAVAAAAAAGPGQRARRIEVIETRFEP
jgi:hypothetical protein